MRQGAGGFFVETRGKDERFLYVWGDVIYTDGFGVCRCTKFCHRYNSLTVVSDGNGGYHIPPEDARYHEYGNEAT